MTDTTPDDDSLAASDQAAPSNDPASSSAHTTAWWSFLQPTSNPLVSTLLFSILLGIAAMAIYAAQVAGHWRSFALALMLGGASFAAGSLLGLLFGVPRSFGAETGIPGTSGGAGPIPTVGANTNLEQISDWLTKVLVGASLVEFKSIGHGLGELFSAIGPDLDQESGTAFAGCLVIFYAVIGFFSGWLFARLRLGAAMSTADALLQLSRRADKLGDRATADAAKTAANQTIRAATGGSVVASAQPAGLDSLASRYLQLRATEPGGPRRTTAMESLVRQGRQLAQTEAFTGQDLRAMIENGSDGQRIMALAIMEGDLRLADPETVAAVIRDPHSPFEHYHALYVTNLIASSMSVPQRDAVRAALTDPKTVQSIGTDTSRMSLRAQILNQLGPPPAP